MCGINGISTAVPSKTALTRNISDMVQMQKAHRGNDSHGLVFIREDGKFVAFRKLGIPNQEKLYEMFAENKTSAAIGHVRLASQGTVNLLNAHPFYNSKVAMIHNGHVYGKNHIKKYNYAKILNVKPRGNTDSEMIFHIFNDAWNGSTNPECLIRALENTIASYYGYANLIFLFKDGTLMAYKDNTLCVKVSDGEIRFASVKPHRNEEGWKRMKDDQVIIVKDGKILKEEVIDILKNEYTHNYSVPANNLNTFVQKRKHKTHSNGFIAQWFNNGNPKTANIIWLENRGEKNNEKN